MCPFRIARPTVCARSITCASLAIVLFGVTAAHAGVVTLTSQTRFVDVTTSGVPGLVGTPTDQRKDAPDFGPFDGSVTLSFPPGTTQSVSQQSTLTLTSDGAGAAFDAHGQLFSGASQNGLNGTTHFQVNFDLSAPESYVLTYNGREGDPRFGNLDKFVPGSFTGPSAPGMLAGDPITTNFFTTLRYSGTLQPGSYGLQAAVNTIGFGSFDLNLAVGSAVGGTAVPLPPAVWVGAGMLLAMPLSRWVWRLRRLRN